MARVILLARHIYYCPALPGYFFLAQPGPKFFCPPVARLDSPPGSQLWMLSAKKFFWEDTSMITAKKQFFFMKKQKMTKKIEFEKLKISQNGQISGFGIFNFSNSNFFCHFWFPIKKNFCFSKQIYFCLAKKIVRFIASIEKKIYYKR